MSKPFDEDRLIDRFIAADEEVMAPYVEQVAKLYARNTILEAMVADLEKRVKKLEGKS